ncbi:MAG: DUF4835 family protein [Capnocytophaga sp.]|nr:DUF4835 family protein [Capnocytophaga sp.]
MRYSIIFSFVCFAWLLPAQEFNAKVTVNTQQISLTDQRIFRTLEKALQEFVNQTAWTNLKVQPNERIQCNFTLIVTKYDSNRFETNLLVQSTRPVYGTSYQTPVVNLQDNNVSFTYQEYEPLSFNINSIQSNLTAIFAYYAYVLLGYDADTFMPYGGKPYFTQANSIVISSQSSGFGGWLDDGSNNRWRLTDELLSETYTDYHSSWYKYHRDGLDMMTTDPQKAKEAIRNAVELLAKVNTVRLNAYAIVLFFNAKADEIKDLFSGGTITDNRELKETLMKIAPFQATKWNEIK